ncbi:unnamed protein product [Caenorhabditis brenneri]
MNSSVFTDPYPFDCDLEYSTFWETSIYLVTVFYLGIGLFLHISIIKTVLITCRKLFQDSSFFHIYVTDSIASALLIIGDLSFNRLFMFVPPLCSIVGPYFWTPSLILKFVMVFLNHLRFSKSVAQIFMVLNRMCCVLMPVTYDQTWRKVTPLVCFLVVCLPFTGTWNMMISRIVVQPIRGGFGINYIRNVQWAAVSLFQSIFILTALVFTIVCTTITLYKLIFLPDRIKSAEKSLCFTSIFISSTFLLVAATQVRFDEHGLYDTFMRLQNSFVFSWNTQYVPPVILIFIILFNFWLLTLLQWDDGADVFYHSLTLSFPKMSSEVISFECDTSYNSFIEIIKYLATFCYLGIGLILHIFLIKTILFTEKKQFRDSSFFHILVMDSFASSIIILCDIFCNRLFMYVPPLCPLVSPYFWSPSLIAKLLYITSNHARFAKSIAQIFMVLNRMSCVLNPIGYNHLWKNATPVAYLLVLILPIGGTWNLWLSRVRVEPQFGGFALSYLRAVQWAALSMFQSFYILSALSFTVVCTSITLYKMIFLPERIKSAEKSLCFTSIFISITYLFVAATQVLWITCCASELLFALQFLAFDTFTVGSAVIVVIANKPLRDSIFQQTNLQRRRSAIVSVVPTHSVVMPPRNSS